MKHIRGMDRNQVILFPEVIDDYITEENPVRFTDAFVDSLNLIELGFKHAEISLSMLAYDITRVINIVGADKLMGEMTTVKVDSLC